MENKMEAFYDKPKKVAFFCVPLNDDISELFNELQERFDLSNKNGTHMTLRFKPNQRDKEDFLPELGNEVIMKPLYILARKGQGATIVFDIGEKESFYRENTLPHVTIGTSFGYPPNISNDIISDWLNGNKNGDIEYIETDIHETSGNLSAAIYGKKGLSYVSQREWVR
jgi:hypothetical protein